jgi:hypothetical protein
MKKLNIGSMLYAKEGNDATAMDEIKTDIK